MRSPSAGAVAAPVIHLQQYRSKATSSRRDGNSFLASSLLRINASADGEITYDWHIPPVLADRLVDVLLLAIVRARQAQTTQHTVSGSNS